MNLHILDISCKWHNSICPFVTLLLSCQQCFQEAALSFHYVLWLHWVLRLIAPANLQPVLLSLHLNLRQTAGWSQRHHHCTHILFFTGSGNSTWVIKLASKAFFLLLSPPPSPCQNICQNLSHLLASLLVPSFLLSTTSLYIYATFYLSAHLLTCVYLYLWTIGNDVAVDIGLQKWFIQEHMLQ